MSMTSTAVSLMASCIPAFPVLTRHRATMEGRWTSTRPTARASSASPPARIHTVDRRPGGQRRVGAAAGARVPRRRRRGGGLPRADAVRLLDRGPPAAGRAARRGRGGAARRRRGVGRPAAGAGGRRAAAAPAPASTTPRSSSTAAGCSASRRSRTCRPTASSTSAASSRRATTQRGDDPRRRRRGAVRPRPAVRRRPTCPASCCTSRSARTCGCRCRRAPRPRWPARRCWPTCPAARSRSAAPRTAACWRARRRRAAWRPTSTPRPGEGESTTDLAWDGQTMIYENGELLAESERFPEGRAALGRRRRPRPAARRSGCGWAPSTTTGATTRRDAESFRRVEFRLDPPAGDIGLRREVERFPFVPADPQRLEQDCYEAYNIQVAGLEQRLRAIGLPEGRHRRLRRARLDPRADRRRPGDGPARPAAQRHPRVHAAGLRDRRRAPRAMPCGSCEALGVTFEEIDIRPTAELMLDGHRPPVRRGEKVYDVTFENVQAGLRTDYLFRLANQRGGIVLGTGDLSELALGWCTYGVGDQMSHYNVNGGVPKTLIQHLIRWVIASEQFDDDGQRGAAVASSTPRSPRSWSRRARTRRSQSTEAKVGPVRAAGLHPVPRAALRLPAVEDRVPGLARLAATPSAATGRRASRRTSGRRTTLAEIRHWLEVFAQRFFSFSQFKRSALPNGPKVSHGGSLSPRGDWRAPSDMSATHLAGRDRTRNPRGLTRLAPRRVTHPAERRPTEHPDGRPPPLIGHRCHGDADDQTDDQRQPEPACLLLAVHLLACHLPHASVAPLDAVSAMPHRRDPRSTSLGGDSHSRGIGRYPSAAAVSIRCGRLCVFVFSSRRLPQGGCRVRRQG